VESRIHIDAFAGDRKIPVPLHGTAYVEKQNGVGDRVADGDEHDQVYSVPKGSVYRETKIETQYGDLDKERGEVVGEGTPDHADLHELLKVHEGNIPAVFT